jgi:dienelactone hydrolase
MMWHGVNSCASILLIALSLVAAGNAFSTADDSLPPLRDGKAPQSLDELWDAYDPRSEPLEAETLKEWERDDVICRVVRYRIGTFKGTPATMVGFYAFPKGAVKLPGLLQIHGGGQSANLDGAVADAKRGYACLSLNWGGNKLNFGRNPPEYDGPNTDWGKLDATHPPQRNKSNHFAGPLTPDDYTLDAIESPRNSNWFLVLIAARRGITFLEQQPEVDPEKIGVYGHSMGGKLTTNLAAIDKRVRVAVPSCGGSGTVLESQTDLPGCVKTSPSALELACVSDNPYIGRLTCPILWLSPTNDFHAVIDNMAVTWRDVPDERVRFSITPHINHHNAAECSITQHLWFEQHLKGGQGGFTMPASPGIEVNLKAADGVPVVAVRPDRSRPVKRVDVFYSTDPHVLTRFWRDGQAVEAGDSWQARCPVMSLDEPFFAFANVTYELPAEYRTIATAPGQSNTDAFTISSREVSYSPEALNAAGVKATDTPDRMIDDGRRLWQDWYQSNWGHPPLWRAFTRKLKDPKWCGPDGAKLVFDVRSETDNQLVVEVETNGWGAVEKGKPAVSYSAVKQLKGSPDWQSVLVRLDELVATDPKFTAPLTNWRTVTQFSIGPTGEVVRDGAKQAMPGKPWAGPREIRNLRWE